MADGLIERVADREPDPGIAAVGRERVRRATDIRADEDLSIKVIGRQLSEREPEHREVILGRVRAGVSRPEDRGHCLAGLVQPAAERVKPIPVLVGG